jgi:hypothetical protein
VAAAVDVNGDGYPDILVVHTCAGTESPCTAGSSLGVLLNNGDGTFQAPVTYSTAGFFADSIRVGDLNGDGKQDVVIANRCGSDYYCSASGTVAVLLGNGNGTFQSAVTYSSGGKNANSVAIADLNKDGHLDIVAANGSELNSNQPGGIGVLLNAGNGTFEPAVFYPSGGQEPGPVEINDVNGDNIKDVVVGNYSPASAIVSVFIGNGDGTFKTPANYSSKDFDATSLAIADVNGDGHQDLIVTSHCLYYPGCATSSVGVLRGKGDGTFLSAVNFSTGGSIADTTRVLAIADVNQDGKPDLLVVNSCMGKNSCANGTIAVLLNTLAAATTNTAFTSSHNPTLVGQPVTFKATVASSNPIPNGSTIKFYEGSTLIGTRKTTNGSASLTTSFSSAGSYTITAKYSGDSFHQPSSRSLTQVVRP